MCAARKQFGGLRRALDILRGDAADEIMRQLLDQADAAALRRERNVAPDRSLSRAVRQKVCREIRRRAAEADMLDARRDLRLGRVAEFQLVEHIAGDPRIGVRAEQAIIQRADIVRARRGEILMTGLNADRRRHCREACVERRKLDFEPAFLLAIGEGLAHAVARKIGRVGEADFVVLVVGRAEPEADRIDRFRVGPVFALRRELGLLGIDAGARVRALDAGDAIERIGLRDRRADEAAVENIRAADRSAAALRTGIGLLAVERLVRVGEIGIGRNEIVAALAPIGVGVDRDVAAGGIEQHRAFDAAIDRIDGGAGFGRDATGLRDRRRMR